MAKPKPPLEEAPTALSSLADALRARGVANVAVAPESDLASRDVRLRGAFLRLAGTEFNR